MELLMLSPASPNRDLTSLQFRLSQKWNLKPVHQESPDEHDLDNLPDRPLRSPKGRRPCHSRAASLPV